MARIRIEYLAPDTDLRREAAERVFGAGRRSLRPTIDPLERRELMAANLGAALTPGPGLLSRAQAARGHDVVRMLSPAHQAQPGDTDRAGVSRLVGPAGAPQAQIANGYLHTQGNQIVDNAGTPVRIVAVNWSGFQSEAGVVDGLWSSDKQYNPKETGGRNYKSMMDQMKKLGFNTIRLLLSSDILTSSPKQYSIDFKKNPDLEGLTSLQVLQKIVNYAGQIGMKIILDHHQSQPGEDARNSEELWYVPGSQKYTPQAWVNFWTTMATTFKNSPAVIGADLHNEPHGIANWGQGNKDPNRPTDWLLAAEQAGNAVLNINPNWLIFVEGVQDYKGTHACWGTNLVGVKTQPVALKVANRVVYSPHMYHFAPPKLDHIDSIWGYIYRDNIAPVWVGEFALSPDQKDWYDRFVTFLEKTKGKSHQPGDKGISWALFNFTPNSKDTEGVLRDTPGWDTVNTNLMGELKRIGA